jgi:hypothetical protein
MNVALISLLVTAIACKAVGGSPALIGNVGLQLSEQELVEIARLASTNAVKPWLFESHRSEAADREFVQVFFDPTTATPEIRRGRMALVSRRLVDSKGTWEAWRLNGRNDYGQVAIPGREFGNVEGEQDLNRPFAVRGKLANEELVTLVKLVRSSPVWRSETGMMQRIEGEWPILSIHRMQDGAIVVTTRKSNSSGQKVTFKIVAKQWHIEAAVFWIT